MRKLTAVFMLLSLLSCYSEHGVGSKIEAPEAKLVNHTVDWNMDNFCSPVCFLASTRKSDEYHEVLMKYSARENHCGQFKLDWALQADTLRMRFVDTSNVNCDTIPAIIFVTIWRFRNMDQLRVRMQDNDPKIDTLILF